MKRLFLLICIISIYKVNAQYDRPIQVEVVDRTEIEMLSAQYRVMQQEQREKMARQNYQIALDNNKQLYDYLYNQLMPLTRNLSTTREKHIKSINKLIDENERLLKRYNSSNYNKKLRELEIKRDREYQSIMNDISLNK